MDFRASYLEIDPRELVAFLLRASGQARRDAVNPRDLIEFLKLRHETFDFDTALPEDARGDGSRPRALLSFSDRLIGVHSGLGEKRARFSTFHEIAHYVLPSHEHTLYLCDEQGLGFSATLTLEREANEFAASLLFQGDRFTLEANSHPVSALTVKLLADKYQASFEATARRLAERNIRPCMLVVFEKDNEAKINIDAEAAWQVKYCVPSAWFKREYCTKISGSVPMGVVASLLAPGRDIADGVHCEVHIQRPDGTPIHADGDFFYNQYNIFCFLVPSASQ